MKEILFRGKSKVTNEWVYGDLIQHQDSFYIVESVEIMNFHGDGTDFNAIDWHKVYNESVGQFIGIRDRNEKEVFEGDIVKYPDGDYSNSENGMDEWEVNNVGEIVYDDENAFFDVTEKIVVDREEVFEGGGDFEVLGNIYENPELITA